MAEEFKKKGGRDRIIYISVVVIIILVVVSLIALKQTKKGEELSGAVTSALQGTEGTSGAGEGGAAGTNEGGTGGGAAGTGSTATTAGSAAKATTTLKPITLAPASDIIKEITELRKESNANEFVKVAGLVTHLNDQFSAGNIDSVAFSWQDVLNCVYDKCPDAKYAKLVDDYVLQDRANSKFMLTHHVVELYNLWNGRNIIQFSESVTNVNTMVAAMNSAKVNDAWKAVVACGGKCQDFPDKIFDMILAVNAA